MALSVVFLIFGVDLLIGSYSLQSPYYFVITFFASNLIILISVAVLLGLVLRFLGKGTPPQTDADEPTDPA